MGSYEIKAYLLIAMAYTHTSTTSSVLVAITWLQCKVTRVLRGSERHSRRFSKIENFKRVVSVFTTGNRPLIYCLSLLYSIIAF